MSTTAALAAAFVPSTPLEEQVAALLAKAKANDAKAVAEAEAQLAVKTLTPQELSARQEQLARMRSVLFHHERRLKRLAKIKSKEYRRRLKKAAQKQVGVHRGHVQLFYRGREQSLYTLVYFVCPWFACVSILHVCQSTPSHPPHNPPTPIHHKPLIHHKPTHTLFPGCQIC